MSEDDAAEFAAEKLAAERDRDRGAPALGFDELVLLSANLTRLVIDPYREQCSSRTVIGEDSAAKPLELSSPVILGGIDFQRMPEAVLRTFLAASVQSDIAIRLPASLLEQSVGIQPEAKVIAIVDMEGPQSDVGAAAAIELSASDQPRITAESISKVADRLKSNDVPIGAAAPAVAASRIALELGESSIDYLAADGQWRGEQPSDAIIPELESGPAIGVIADCIDALRGQFREEIVGISYCGGVRGGADATKAICLGASTVCVGLGALLSLGYRILGRSINEPAILKAIQADLNEEEAVGRLVNYIKSIVGEVTMLARAAGKTNIHNLEPEDLRSMTIETSAATGVPLCGKDWNFRPGR